VKKLVVGLIVAVIVLATLLLVREIMAATLRGELRDIKRANDRHDQADSIQRDSLDLLIVGRDELLARIGATQDSLTASRARVRFVRRTERRRADSLSALLTDQSSVEEVLAVYEATLGALTATETELGVCSLQFETCAREKDLLELQLIDTRLLLSSARAGVVRWRDLANRAIPVLPTPPAFLSTATDVGQVGACFGSGVAVAEGEVRAAIGLGVFCLGTTAIKKWVF